MKLNARLMEVIGDFKKKASDFRLKEVEKDTESFDFGQAVNDVLGYVATGDFQDTIFNKQVLPVEVIEKTNDETLKRIMSRNPEVIELEINRIKVKVLMSEDSSPHDPYLIVKLKSVQDTLTIIINKNHSYWLELSSKEAIYSFIVSCIYDGLSEWKACFIVGNMEPDTIKMIKDSFLRMPLKYK